VVGVGGWWWWFGVGHVRGPDPSTLENCARRWRRGEGGIYQDLRGPDSGIQQEAQKMAIEGERNRKDYAGTTPFFFLGQKSPRK